MTKTMYDAAFPPPPPGVDVVAGYIGGNTPHVWTDAEWAASGKRWRLPIFTRSHDGDPVADAKFCVTWLKSHAVPVGATLALDFETRVDPVYLRSFDVILMGAGYKTMVYGSLTFVVQNPRPSGGYWAAHWTNVSHICSTAGVVATQWGGDATLGKPYDLNLVSDSVPLWDTQGESMTDAQMAELKNYIADQARFVARWVDHGDNTVPGTGNNLKNVRTDIAALVGVATTVKTELDALATSGTDVSALAAALAPLLQGTWSVTPSS